MEIGHDKGPEIADKILKHWKLTPCRRKTNATLPQRHRNQNFVYPLTKKKIFPSTKGGKLYIVYLYLLTYKYFINIWMLLKYCKNISFLKPLKLSGPRKKAKNNTVPATSSMKRPIEDNYEDGNSQARSSKN